MTGNRRLVTAVLLLLVMGAVGGVALSPRGVLSGGVPDAVAPEVIYHSARVVTVSPSFDIAEAVAIRDGRIVAVGSNREVRGLAGRATRQIDLAGKTVLPGFYDNHVHIGGEILQEWNGALISGVPEWIRGANTKEKLFTTLRQRAAETPKGQWILGGLTREEWPNQALPTRWELDEAVPDHPLALTRGPHTVILNSRAFEIAKITRDTPDPPGGWIIRDERGEPSGRVLETAKRLVDPYIPKDPPSGRTEMERFKAGLEQLLPLGLTSVNVAGIRPQQLRVLQELYEQHGESLPRMTVQVRISPGYDSYDDPVEGARIAIQEIESLGFHTGHGNDRLKIGAIKMSIDGGLSAPVMWTTQAYATRVYSGEHDFHGVQRIPAETYYQVAKRAHDLGWQLGIHTIGDGAVGMVVDINERILRESPREDHRHFLHHVSVKPADEVLRKMGALGMMVATHPSWTNNLGAYSAEVLGSSPQLQRINPSRSLLDHGIRISYGSDGLPYGPLFNISTAVTRRGWDGKVYGPEEAVNVEEAIRFHTIGTAFMTFDEAKKGSIEVGKFADLVVLGQDILSVDPDSIKSIPVERTIIGGREVFVRN